MSDIKVKVKIAAYEKGILPTKLSQLENDVPYASEPWVKDYVKEHGAGISNIDGGNIQNQEKIRLILNCGDISEPITPGNIYDGGDIENDR